MVIISSGDDYEFSSFTIGNSDVEIMATRPVKSWSIRELSGQVALQCRRTSGSAVYWPVFPGEAFGFTVTKGKRSGLTNVLGYIRRDVSGSDVNIVLAVTF